MDLLIVRHAIAFERNPKRWHDDSERPLSPDGMVRARKTAAGIKRIAERPVRVLTSPLVRAKQTAAILTDCAGWPKAVECVELSPEETPEALLKVLREIQDKRIAVVGHQPSLGQLIASCLPGSVRPEAFDLKKMGVASLSFQNAPRAGQATLHWLAPPRILRAVR
jgi:phosphohistidine phosphatase